MNPPEEVIPLVDLPAQHAVVADEVREGWESVCKDADFILGAVVAEFEEQFAAASGVRHCIGVANGTDALELALRAAGVGDGDEVILPANSYIASALAVVRSSAIPVLVDVDPECLLIRADQALDRIGPRTKAVMPVHLYGQIAPMEAFEAIAADGTVAIVEDAAQAHGATREGVGAGAFGVAAGTSFYPGKNLGAYGDAGAVLTQSDEVADAVRALRNYGQVAPHRHESIGFNSRLDTIQAVVLSAKLRHLVAWNEARAKAAATYDELLSDFGEVGRPQVLPGNVHVWHLYVVRVPSRDEVLAALRAAGVGAQVHYPVPIHLQPAFKSLGHQVGDFPESERASNEVLSLPIFPEITVEQQERVVRELARALGR